MINLCLSSIAIIVFIVYNISIICKFGLIQSLSDSFYYLNDYKKNLGYLFTVMMFTCALMLLPAWLNITESISTWSQYLTVLPFLGAGSIAFVGAAPGFRDCDMENKVHTISAICAATFSLLWVAVVCWKITWLIPLWAIIIGAIAHLTKTQKSCLTYWLELIAFGSTFSAIVIESILLM